MNKLLVFIRKSFEDPRGIPDAKLITTFAFAILILSSIPYGLMTGKWMPEYAFSNIMLLIGAGLGLSSFEIKAAIKANPESTETPVQACLNAIEDTKALAKSEDKSDTLTEPSL